MVDALIANSVLSFVEKCQCNATASSSTHHISNESKRSIDNLPMNGKMNGEYV